MKQPLHSQSRIPAASSSGDPALAGVIQRLMHKLSHDRLVQDTTDDLRTTLQVNRVVLYSFYRQWQGQVTFESLSADRYSIIGSTGADECFNQDYADMYLMGRVRAIANIATEPIHPCHKEFLLGLNVKANLAVPVISHHQLWGLLIAHHCESPRDWFAGDASLMLEAAEHLATSSTIQAP